MQASMHLLNLQNSTLAKHGPTIKLKFSTCKTSGRSIISDRSVTNDEIYNII